MAKSPSKSAARNSAKDSLNVKGGIGLRLLSFTVAELTAAGFLASEHPGAIVAVSNGSAGSACLAFSNGTAWKVVALGATIAAS